MNPIRISILGKLLLVFFCTTACTEQNYDENDSSTKEESYNQISLDTALTVSQAKMVMQQKGSCYIAVKGYIVGCINGTSLSQFQDSEPFLKESNLVIADSTNEKDPARLMPVKLVNQSTPRKDLNLMEHPDYQYRLLYIYGKMDTYFKTTGITSIKAYVLGAKKIDENIIAF